VVLSAADNVLLADSVRVAVFLSVSLDVFETSAVMSSDADNVAD
jgi:hypothetical protein